MSTRTFRVYIAAPKLEVTRARRVVRELTARGVTVVSTWHATYTDGAPDPDDAPTARSILDTNLLDIAHANVVLALTSDAAGRETYVEIGRVLGRDPTMAMRVVWSAERGGLALSHVDANVLVAPTDAAAIDLVLALAKERA